MDFKDFTTGKDDSDRRLDRVLRIFLSNKGLPEIYKLLRKGLIKLNHKKAKPETHVAEGDIISIASFLFDDNSQNNKQKSMESSKKLNVVFENEHLLIIDKPYDQTVHGKTDGLYKDVINYLEESQALTKSLSFKPGPLHRLDRRTTGLLVFSKSLEGARWFTEGIKNHKIQKKYFGLAQGKLLQQETWKDFITEDGETDEGFYTVKALSQKDLKENHNSVECITTATPLAYGTSGNKTYTLVEYAIKTGRKHQIRSQSALHNFPLAGDTAYGAEALNSRNSGKRQFFLQAYCLNFPENPFGLPSQVKISLSPDFIEQLQCCGIEKTGL